MATKTKSAPKKVRVTAADKAAARTHKARDLSPRWDGCDTWSSEQFTKHYREAMFYYNMNHSGKELKPAVIQWMANNGYTKDQIKLFKSTKDWRSNLTMGSIASCLNRGMQTQRPDFNNGHDTAHWLKRQIEIVLVDGVNDIEEEVPANTAVDAYTPSIQDRLRDASAKMVDEIEDAIEAFQANPEAFDPKSFKVLNLLKAKQAKAAHSRIIKGFYNRQFEELQEAQAGKDPQLKEAYAHLSKSNLKKIIAFYHEIVSACDMLAQEAKVNRKPRAKKPTDKAKVVAKLKYMKAHEPLKLVSVNPVDIIGAKELWIYNVKTRKLGRYVTSEFSELAVKGTSILGYDETKSVQKTLRKPEEKLKEFKTAGKVALRKFLDEINSVDVKLNGRINEDTLLLKVS